MTSRPILAAIALAIWSGASTVSATPLIVGFSFTDQQGGEAVTGIVLGLVDDVAGVQAATSVKVTTSSVAFGTGEYVGSPLANSWRVSGGQITSFDFLSKLADNSAWLWITSVVPTPSGAGVGGIGVPDPNTPFSVSADSVITFTVTAVPLPATLPLVVAGLAGLGLFSRRRRAA